jgi:DNA end-binding protein Ku
LVTVDEFELPGKNLREYGVQKKEIDLAAKLIEGMTAEWDPTNYHDEYRDVLLNLIQRKVDAGQTEAIEDVEVDEEPVRQTINFMDVLKKSVAHTSKSRSTGSRLSSSARSNGRKKKPASRGRRTGKQRAG